MEGGGGVAFFTCKLNKLHFINYFFKKILIFLHYPPELKKNRLKIKFDNTTCLSSLRFFVRTCGVNRLQIKTDFFLFFFFASDQKNMFWLFSIFCERYL